jgi:hypothetical protein
MHTMNAVEKFRPRRILVCLLIGIAALASWWPRWGGPIDLRWDGGAYYILGTSLTLGEGYRMLSEPGGLPSSLHPPFVPALVAAHQLLLQTTDPVVVGRALRVTVALCSAAYAMVVFLLLAASLPPMLAAAVTLLCVLQPQYVFFSDLLFAETFFGLFTALFFVVRKYRQDRLGFLLCGLCAALAFAARTAGIALLVAWVVDHALRKEARRAFSAFVVSAMLVTSWMGWIKVVESSPEYRQPAYAYQTEAWLYFNVSYARNVLTYFDPWRPELGPLTPTAFVRRLLANVEVLPQAIGQAVSSWTAPAHLALPLAMLVLGGLVLQAVRRDFAVVLYIVLSLAVMCATPFQDQFARYMLPLFPFLALALFDQLAWAIAQARRLWPALPVALGAAIPWLVVVVLWLSATRDLREMYAHERDDVAYEHHGHPVRYRLFHYAPEGNDFDAALDWLDRRAAPDDTVASGDSQWVYLRTGRRCVAPPFVIDGREGQQLIDSVPVKYLLAPVKKGLPYEKWQHYDRFTAPLLAENPGAWRRVWSGANGTLDVYERVEAPRR